jgi:MraZ protein
MFRGRFAHTIDAKGRVSIPASFRVELQEHDERPPFLTNLPRCLALYPNDQWLKIEERVANLSQIRPEVQAYQRFLVSGAQPCPIDRQGRMLVPPTLREHAGLEREVIIAGVGPRIEMWDRERFDEELRLTIERSDEISSVLADLGL